MRRDRVFGNEKIDKSSSKYSTNSFSNHIADKLKDIKLSESLQLNSKIISQNKTEDSNLDKSLYRINKPYPYQIKIFEQIKDNNNSIIFMETGKGKTLISVMLMGHLLNFDVFDPKKVQPQSKHKKIVFLVCEVALVEQQKLVISQNTSLTVEALSSKKMKKFKGDVKKFKKFWEICDVFVSTHQIIYNLLSCGFITIFDIDLLIFDECHHMDGNHPYNIIMSEFYFFYKYNTKIEDEFNLFSEKKLPKILGLTASPFKKKLDGSDITSTAYKALNQICENMDAVIVIDPDVLSYDESIGDDLIYNLSEEDVKREYIGVKGHKLNKNFGAILSIIHANLLTPILNYIFDNIDDEEVKDLKSDYLKFVIDKFDSDGLTEYNKYLSQYKYLYELRKKSWMFSVFEKIQINLFMILTNLSSRAVYIFLDKYREYFENLKIQFKDYSNKSILISKTTPNPDKEIFAYSKYRDFQLKNLTELNKIIYQAQKNLQVNENEKKFESHRLISLLTKIVELFQSDKANESFDSISNLSDPRNSHRLIIFVENRIISEILSGIINEHLDKMVNTNLHDSHKIQSLSVVGVGKKQCENSFYPKNSAIQINEKIKRFTHGSVQIMVCTSTVEEGLDVKQCDAVMVFTELRTTKSYIQMKGRARKSNAKFCIFTPDVNKTIATIRNHVMLIISMRKLFKDGISKDFRDEDSMFAQKNVEFYHHFVESTHAKLTFKNVTNIFNEFYQVMNERFKKIIKKKINFYEEKNVSINFRAEMRIDSEWFPPKLSVIHSPPFNDKASAENYCYLEFLMICHQLQFIDDNFQIYKIPK